MPLGQDLIAAASGAVAYVGSKIWGTPSNNPVSAKEELADNLFERSNMAGVGITNPKLLPKHQQEALRAHAREAARWLDSREARALSGPDELDTAAQIVGDAAFLKEVPESGRAKRQDIGGSYYAVNDGCYSPFSSSQNKYPGGSSGCITIQGEFNTNAKCFPNLSTGQTTNNFRFRTQLSDFYWNCPQCEGLITTTKMIVGCVDGVAYRSLSAPQAGRCSYTRLLYTMVWSTCWPEDLGQGGDGLSYHTYGIYQDFPRTGSLNNPISAYGGVSGTFAYAESGINAPFKSEVWPKADLGTNRNGVMTFSQAQDLCTVIDYQCSTLPETGAEPRRCPTTQKPLFPLDPGTSNVRCFTPPTCYGIDVATINGCQPVDCSSVSDGSSTAKAYFVTPIYGPLGNTRVEACYKQPRPRNWSLPWPTYYYNAGANGWPVSTLGSVTYNNARYLAPPDKSIGGTNIGIVNYSLNPSADCDRVVAQCALPPAQRSTAPPPLTTPPPTTPSPSPVPTSTSALLTPTPTPLNETAIDDEWDLTNDSNQTNKTSLVILKTLDIPSRSTVLPVLQATQTPYISIDEQTGQEESFYDAPEDPLPPILGAGIPVVVVAGAALAGLTGAAIAQEKRRRKHANLPTLPPAGVELRSTVTQISVKLLEEATAV